MRKDVYFAKAAIFTSFCLEMDTFVNAVQFAAHKHRFQKRKDADGTPYINHPIGRSIDVNQQREGATDRWRLA